MRTTLFAVVVMLEIYIALQLSLLSPHNTARMRYRQEERAATWKALAEHRSAETEAAVREESRLASRYHTQRELIRCGALFAAFLVLDGVWLYSRKWSRDMRIVNRLGVPPELPPGSSR